MPTIERVRELSSLTTLRVEVADAFTTGLQGRTGGTTAVLVVRGDVAVGVDLSAARFTSLDHASRRATLLLPRPRVESARLDHERTRLVGVWADGLWTIVPGGREADAVVVNDAYRQARRAVARAAEDPALTARARRRAEDVLRAFAAALGWEAQVTWADAEPPAAPAAAADPPVIVRP